MYAAGNTVVVAGSVRVASAAALTIAMRFGFTNPVPDDEIIAGHGRVMAAKELGLATVPTLKLSHLSAAKRRAYVLADNKLALNAGWDNEILAIELQALINIDFDPSLTGFSLAEIDLAVDQAGESAPRRGRARGCRARTTHLPNRLILARSLGSRLSPAEKRDCWAMSMSRCPTVIDGPLRSGYLPCRIHGLSQE